MRFARRALGIDVRNDHTFASLHGDERELPGLDTREEVALNRVRLLGATATVMMAIGALGAGAQPVLQNPVAGMRLFSLLSRMPTTAMAITMTGAVLLVLSWLLLGRFALGTTRRLTRAQLDRTLLLWILPLTVAPPMFSRDVYSYLAQSEITARGIDPYSVGPAQALGVDHVLTRTVPTIWRDTPAPYGPLSLWLGRGISAIVGDNIVAGIFLHRLLALVGVALIVWALPRLARRCGVAVVSALWLGAANPLVIFHLVSGVHNEALMIGLMVAGLELCLRAIDSTAELRGPQFWLFLGGVSVLALSSTVKIPSALALGFVWLALTRRWGGSLRALVTSAALMGAVALAVTLVVSFGSGLGFGWINTLGTANAVRSWMSLPTSTGIATGFVGVLLGLGDHTTAILSIARPIAACAAGLIVVRMLVATYSGRLPAVGALGVAFGAVVLFFPVVQPWYLLWGVIPLAAWATRPAFRIATICFSTVVCVITMPTGKDESPWVVFQASVATTVVCVLVIVATRNVLPWRAQRRAPEPEPRTGAYAESS